MPHSARASRLDLALTDETGNLIWISPARRGAVSKITAARLLGLDVQ